MPTIEILGNLGDFIGAIAVLITLVYLAIQLRNASRATHRQTYNTAAEAVANFSLTLAQDPVLHHIYRTTLIQPDSLSADELLRGFTVLDAYMSLMEAYFLHNRDYGEVQSQERWARVISRILRLPGGDRYWQERRWTFHSEFADYVDSLLPVAGG